MIVGVTCEKDGTIIRRLPVNTKVAVGLGPSAKKNHPETLDAFVFLRRGEGQSEWILDEKLMKHYAPLCKHEPADTCPTCCRLVNVLFLDDDIDHVFPNEYAWWGSTNKRCWGDGVKATRRTDTSPNGMAWTPCGETCPDLVAKRCKPSADLYFLLADFPLLGSVCRLHTSSARSIKNLFGGLMQIAAVTDGKLAGVTIPLQVSWEKTSYIGNDGKPRPTEVPILGFKADINELVQNINKTAVLFSTARKALGASRAVVVENEDERAAEISAEFSPKALPEGPAPATTETNPLPQQPARPAQLPATAQPVAVQRPVTTQEATKPARIIEKASYEGLVKSVTPAKVGRGANKGKEFWKVVLENQTQTEKSDMHLVTDSGELAGQLANAHNRSQEVQLACDIIIQEKAKSIVIREMEKVGGWLE